MAIQTQRRTFTVGEYHRMVEAGILTEDDRVELLCGEITTMAPVGSRHALCVKGLNAMLSEGLRRQAVVGIQDPIVLGESSEPQPDVSVARPPRRRYAESHPAPPDIFFVVEVSDTTLLHDRNVKLPLYACAGIPEVWIVDLGGLRVEVYRSPSPEGYRDVHYALPGEHIAPLAFPDVSLAVDEMLA